MPVFYQHTINEETKPGVWKIEETENFFRGKVPVSGNISHPHKRLQHLAGRYLLQYLFPDFPYDLILIADTRKPFLSNEIYHFSISHCDGYAAAVVSKQNRVGVDIEQVRPVIESISHKFLSETEVMALTAGEKDLMQAADQFVPSRLSPGLLTLAWSAKEAVYKWEGKGGLDFKKHMQLQDGISKSRDGWIRSSVVYSREIQVHLSLYSRFFADLVLTYVVT